MSASFAYNSPVRMMRGLPSARRLISATIVVAFVVVAALILDGKFSITRAILIGIAAFAAAWAAALFGVSASTRDQIDSKSLLNGSIAALVALMCAAGGTTDDERGRTLIAALALGISVLVWVSAIVEARWPAGYDATVGPLALLIAATGLLLLPSGFDADIGSAAGGMVLAAVPTLLAAVLVARHVRRGLVILALLAIVGSILIVVPEDPSPWLIAGSLTALLVVADSAGLRPRERAELALSGLDALVVAAVAGFLALYLAFSMDAPVRGFLIGALAVLGSAVALFQRAVITQRETRMTELALQNEQIRARARLDPLTGLPNRAALDARLLEEVERSVRYGQPLSVCFVDIDHFKSINDTCGHQVGDEVLRSLATVLRSTVRTPDFVARYGGEEFVIIAPGTWTADAEVLGGRIQEAVARQAPQPLGRPVTVSIGIAGVPEHGRDPGIVLRLADMALYVAKGAGRDRVEIAQVDPPLLPS